MKSIILVCCFILPSLLMAAHYDGLIGEEKISPETYMDENGPMSTMSTINDMASLLNDCQSKQKCAIQTMRGRKLDSPTERSCGCDQACAEYDDCCEDSKWINYKPKLNVSCVLAELSDFYMIDYCPPGEKDSRLVENCRKGMVEGDLLGSLPVTDIQKGLTYRNLYCASCHNDLNDKVFWNPVILCEVSLDQKSDYITENLRWNDETKDWRILVEEMGKKVFRRCSIRVRFPNGTENALRPCKTNVVNDCPPDADPEVARMCRRFQGIRYYEDNQSVIPYRNLYCAQCHGINATSLSCAPKGGRNLAEDPLSARSPFYSTAFPILLDISSATGRPATRRFCSGKNEIYDVFKRKCRAIHCIGKDQIMSDERCHLFKENPEKHNSESGNETGSSFFDCSKIAIRKEEFIQLENSSIFLVDYNITYNNDSYISDPQDPDIVYVCANSIEFENSLNKFSPEMGLITTIGLSISIVALLCHIIVFTMVSEVRNLSGQNLLCLSIALVLAYSSFIMMQSPQVQKSRHLCRISGIMVFYFFMASMAWMNVIALDIWRTLRMATIELRVSNGRQKLRFLCYSLYAWTFSGTFVSAAVISDIVPGLIPEDFRPGFGKTGHCWFEKRQALIVFFAAPVACIMCINFMSFIFSVFMIRKSTAESKTFSSHPGATGIDHKLYLKLLLLMGLTWIVGFVASSTDSLYLWYLFVILNTLQGLFIFIAFSCKRKVYTTVSGVITRLTSSLSGTTYTWSSNLSQNQSKLDGGSQSKSTKNSADN